MKNRIRKLSVYLLITVALILLLFFIFRNVVLDWGINRVSDKLKNEAGMALTLGSARCTGFTGVTIHCLAVTPSHGDTLLSIDTLAIRISPWMLLIGTIRMKEINGSGIRVILSCSDSICNYSGLIHEKKVSNKAAVTTRNFAYLFKRALDKIFNLAPQKAQLNDLSFTYKSNELQQTLKITEMHSDENTFNGNIKDVNSNSEWAWLGKFSQTHHTVSFSLFPVYAGKWVLPILPERLGIAAGFDTLHVALNGYHGTRNKFTTQGEFYVKNLFAFHKKISDDTIHIPSSSIYFNFSSGKTTMELDSSSKLMLDSIEIKPYLRFASDARKEYELKLETPSISSNDFFNSLPVGIFDEVRGIQADGKLKLKLNFLLNSDKPDDVKFDVQLKKENFRIRKSGSINLYKINDEFTHIVYEKDQFVRSFSVGPSNPYFTPLEAISPDFVNAVLTSEDGNFFYHNGFNVDAFRKSIAANYRAGKFVRGGSTISMQLVKNVFLTRKKTIARKAEEALLVWLIESNRLSSKSRMLEVYFNVIELGPGVYGIGEAASFYFNKRPAELNLSEGIFLASLLPRPKAFKYSFDTLGNLKPHLADYYRIVSDFMLRKNLITREQHDQLIPNVRLSGPAREIVLPADSIQRRENENDGLIRQ